MSTAIEKLIQPRSIAIIGASADFHKLNGRVMKFLIDHGFRGDVYPVNPKYDAIGDLKCYPSVDELPKAADLAVITVPAALVSEAVAACGRKGIEAAVLFSSGFKEVGGDGVRLEQELIATAEEAGVRICGPNTIGLINCFDNAFASFTQYGYGANVTGPVSFISQSGAFGTAIAALARDRGIGLGYFISTGNECDLSVPEITHATLEDDRINVATCYVEGIKHGDNWIALAERSLELSKPVVITKVGRTDAGKRAAASHTGSLAGAEEVFDGIARQYGLIRARNEEHMMDLADAFMLCDLPEGPGVAVITQSGGAGVMMTDRAVELGLNVPQPSEDVREAVKEVIPAFGSANNPIDVTAQFLMNPAVLRDSVVRVFDDPDIHIAVIWLQLMHDHVDLLVDIFKQAKALAKKPFMVAWVGASEEAREKMREIGICCLRGGEPAIDAVAGLVQFAETKRRYGTVLTERAESEAAVSLLGDHSGVVGSIAAGAMLAEAGVNLPQHSLCQNAAEAVAAAKTFGGKVALKVESPDILHKTDAGGVRLGLEGKTAVDAAYGAIVSAAKTYDPNAKIEGVLVEAMAEPAVEMVIGLKRDPAFGNVIMVGLGGVFVEVMKDVAIRLCPVTLAEALHMLETLRSSSILDGVRGGPVADRTKLAQMIVDVSRFGAAAGDNLVELDLNPVFAGPDGAVAVDWLMVTKE
ncbi:MAG TPA: CoA-binding protein [Rhodospirillaceae bacterium]|nr:CoA-binding protein [Rhodospirillaceae bacterium]HAA93469.1 CoA-binding protein [Rhodospirillaceae bacterium]HAT36221.1 CoA-binding protein [Rhodospirillaceae bacterium]